MKLLLSLFILPLIMSATQPQWYDCQTREVFTPEKQVWCDRLQILLNTNYLIPTSHQENPEYITITLEKGEYRQLNGGVTVIMVNEPNWLTFGDINNDGKMDAAVILGVVINETDLATYLTVVLDIDNSPQPLSPVLLGERIMLNGPIGISPGQVIIPQLTQTEVIERVFEFSE